MSKIGKINISIPEKVKVALSGNIINVEGPLGKKSLNIDLDIFDLNINEGKEISIKPKKINQETKRLWGMNRSLLNNAIIGTNVGYEKILELTGVGFRAALKGNQLNLQLGFSHDVIYEIPKEVKVIVEKSVIIKISGIDKELVGRVASEIKMLKPVEPYKAKGIKISVEKQTVVKISGFDKQQVGMVVSKIKSLRPPEPYKGKGIKEKGQYILRKEGKKK